MLWTVRAVPCFLRVEPRLGSLARRQTTFPPKYPKHAGSRCRHASEYTVECDVTSQAGEIGVLHKSLSETSTVPIVLRSPLS